MDKETRIKNVTEAHRILKEVYEHTEEGGHEAKNLNKILSVLNWLLEETYKE